MVQGGAQNNLAFKRGVKKCITGYSPREHMNDIMNSIVAVREEIGKFGLPLGGGGGEKYI